MGTLWTKHEPIRIVENLPRHPTKVYDKRTKADCKRIVLHTTDWDTDPKVIANYDINPNHISSDGCPAVTYHDFIMKDGTVYHSLDYNEVSWHAGIWNPGSIAVALMYRCTKDGQDSLSPTIEALRSMYAHVGELCLIFGILPDNVLGHRELKGTGWFWFKGSKKLRKTCPGLQVNLDLVRLMISKYVQTALKAEGLYKGTIDGIFGTGSKKAFDEYLIKYNVV